MKKLLIVLVMTMLGFASVASTAEKIGDLAWSESNIKTLRAFHKAAVLHFYFEQTGREGVFSESDFWVFDSTGIQRAMGNMNWRSTLRLALTSLI